MIPKAAPSDEFLDRIRASTAKVGREVAAVVDGLTPDQLGWTPPDGGWSIGQVLEHLVVAGQLYVDRMSDAVEGATRTSARHATTVWRPSFVGKYLIRALSPDRRAKRLPAPKVFKPGPSPRADVHAAFVRHHAELVELADRAAGLDLSRVKTSSPVSRLIRINLGDCFAIVATHAERHLEQMRAVRGHASFPNATVSVV